MAPIVRPEPLPSGVESPEDDAALREQLGDVIEEKRQALADPGPSWRDWWFFHASKWYILIGLLVVDAWVVGIFFEVGLWAAGVLSLFALFYVNYALYCFLYFRPDPEAPRRRGKFRRTLIHPFEYGRWTPEAELVRSGGMLDPGESGPRPEEFL